MLINQKHAYNNRNLNESNDVQVNIRNLLLMSQDKVVDNCHLSKDSNRIEYQKGIVSQESGY